jgi:hypothetical protein
MSMETIKIVKTEAVTADASATFTNTIKISSYINLFAPLHVGIHAADKCK